MSKLDTSLIVSLAFDMEAERSLGKEYSFCSTIFSSFNSSGGTVSFLASEMDSLACLRDLVSSSMKSVAEGWVPWVFISMLRLSPVAGSLNSGPELSLTFYCCYLADPAYSTKGLVGVTLAAKFLFFKPVSKITLLFEGVVVGRVAPFWGFFVIDPLWGRACVLVDGYMVFIGDLSLYACDFLTGSKSFARILPLFGVRAA